MSPILIYLLPFFSKLIDIIWLCYTITSFLLKNSIVNLILMLFRDWMRCLFLLHTKIRQCAVYTYDGNEIVMLRYLYWHLHYWRLFQFTFKNVIFQYYIPRRQYMESICTIVFSLNFFLFIHYNGNEILNKYKTTWGLKLQYFLGSFYWWNWRTVVPENIERLPYKYNIFYWCHRYVFNYRYIRIIDAIIGTDWPFHTYP